MATFIQVDNSKLLAILHKKINDYDNKFNGILTPIYFGPNDKIGMALAELAAYLEIASLKDFKILNKISRQVTYNKEVCYDNLDDKILDDYEKFCSVFLDF
jgi:hypothetical protein